MNPDQMTDALTAVLASGPVAHILVIERDQHSVGLVITQTNDDGTEDVAFVGWIAKALIPPLQQALLQTVRIPMPPEDYDDRLQQHHHDDDDEGEDAAIRNLRQQPGWNII